MRLARHGKTAAEGPRQRTQLPPSRRGSTRVAAATNAPMRSGCVASTHITPIMTSAASPASTADTSIGRRKAGGSEPGSEKPQT